MAGKTIGELKVGESASIAKTITESDVYTFAGVTCDYNPAHLDEEASKKGMFGRRIAHGMLTAGLVSAVLGTRLPGPGTIYMAQEMRFRKPVFFGDTITATVTVRELLAEKNIVKLDTVATNQNGDVVMDGIATMMPPKA